MEVVEKPSLRRKMEMILWKTEKLKPLYPFLEHKAWPKGFDRIGVVHGSHNNVVC